MKEIYRKLMLLGLVIFIGIGVFYTYKEGKKQDRGFVEDSQSYQHSLAQMQEEDYKGAKEQLINLHNKYPDQAIITRNLGLVYAIEGEMDKAALYYKKAVDQRPFIIQDPMFTLQFAEILLSLEENDAAKEYLEYSKKLGIPEEFKGHVEELLAYIETMK
ncbi:tetratricopeptide repeat protein [Bacillus sp. JJ1532]|uniref:tetratricopeptide repeat protein n=1 Tax=Bacillus sp. JJ1532 TaxID=3122958 RepID=UPI002FFFE2B7